MGTRGYGSPFPMEKFARVSGVEYLQQANDAILTCVQIETAEALKNVSSCMSDSYRPLRQFFLIQIFTNIFHLSPLIYTTSSFFPRRTLNVF